MCLLLKASLAVCAQCLVGWVLPWLGGHGWMWGRGQDAGSSRFVAHQCMAGGPHLHGAAQGSELCCTCSKLLQLYLSTAFHVGYSPRSCIQLLSPCSISLQCDGTTQAGSEPGVHGWGTRPQQLPRSISRFHDRPQIQPRGGKPPAIHHLPIQRVEGKIGLGACSMGSGSASSAWLK